jgi:hypothetical protein
MKSSLSDSTQNRNAISLNKTIWLNALRSLSSGALWTIASLAFSSPFSPFLVLLLAPFIYVAAIFSHKFISIFPFAVGGGKLAEFIIIALELIIRGMICIGDPLIFAVYQINPSILPIKDFKPINFKMYLLAFK